MTTLASPRALTLSRWFAAPPERVFDAWTGSDWGDWLPPQNATCRVAAIDARTGGSFRLEMTMPDGRELRFSGSYREVRRPEFLSFTWEGDVFGSRTVVSVTLQPEGDGTRLRLHQEGFAEDDARGGYERGWSGPGGSFDKLAVVLGQRDPHD